MGYLLPVLYMVQDKLKQKQAAAEVCAPLFDALQSWVKSRFSTIMQEPEMIAAASYIPNFCKTWTNDTLEKGSQSCIFYSRLFSCPCLDEYLKSEYH